MRFKMMWVRVLSAMVLFLILTQANVWTDTKSHLVLAVGYRAFIFCAPLFLYFGLNNAMILSLALCCLGVVGAFFSVNSISLGIFALGMAVSGYLAKYVAAHSSQGAADNKVSLNIGSLASGLILIYVADQKTVLTFCLLALIIAAVIALKVDWGPLALHTVKKSGAPINKIKLELIPLIGWGLIGVATGIKLTGIFAVLPQYVLKNSNSLPHWFGSLIILNSLVVIFLQHRIFIFLDGFKRWMTTLFSLSAMIILSLPALFKVENFTMAGIWILLLTLGECALSRYDRIAKDEGYLFPKELMVGIGSFLTVALSRNYANHIYLSGSIGTVCLLLGTLAISAKSICLPWSNPFSRAITEAS
jgi:hypothetical protein